MAQEEHNQKCSNSSSGGGGSGGGGGGGSGGGGNRSSKRLKQKKVPQRGLGVAQLEKIRLEEQQQKDVAATILSPNSSISTNKSSSCLGVQSANFRPNLSPPSIPLPPPSPTDLPSPRSIFRQVSLVKNTDVLHQNSVPLSNPLNVDGNEIGWSMISSPGHVNWPNLWNGEYNLEGENHRLDHDRFAFRSNVNLPYASYNTPIWPLPNVMQKSQQFQQHYSSSMVNVSSGISSSSAINFQMEPPSNQSYHGNNYIPLLPEEEKMVGMKRRYPFSLDNPTGPSFQCKFPPTYVAPISRLDESASCSNGGTANIESIIPVFREGPSNSAMPEPNRKEVIKENGGNFLTLAPPTSSKNKHLSAYLGSHSRESYESYQGCIEEQGHRPGPSSSTQQPFFSFFPSAIAKEQAAIHISSNSSNGEVAANVDLNLKL